MLGIVMRWHKSREIFEQECVGYPGFVTKFRVTTSDAQGEKDSKGNSNRGNYKFSLIFIKILKSKLSFQITWITKIIVTWFINGILR